MDILDSNKLRINVAATSHAATIFLSGHFSFDAHREFKAAYQKHLEDAAMGTIIVNLADVHYLDSAALGMLLVLREQAQAANKSLILSNPSSIAVRTFNIASFDKVFTIN